ncbi:MAG: tRNA epoxyqueuosine(34) reductase QueG [Bacteroidota bacterium]
MSVIEQHTAIVKKVARELGFDYCGIAQAKRLEEDERKLTNWLQKGLHGNMHYMENYFDLRVDPTRLVPGAKSVITLLLNYYPSEKQEDTAPRISKYAYGKDYHLVIKEKLYAFLAELKASIGAIEGRGFVDSAPVLERAWAREAGLGWIGKNGNLIHKNAGSFYFIATLITDLKLQADNPFTKDFCGTCNRCVEACPTGAILPEKVIDGSRCISYYTIELKSHIKPTLEKGQLDGWLFGCDTCQDVCPWNRFSKPHTNKNFNAIPEILQLSTSQWEEMTEETFKQVFGNSPLQRTRFKGIKRNLQLLRELS